MATLSLNEPSLPPLSKHFWRNTSETENPNLIPLYLLIDDDNKPKKKEPKTR